MDRGKLNSIHVNFFQNLMQVLPSFHQFYQEVIISTLMTTKILQILQQLNVTSRPIKWANNRKNAIQITLWDYLFALYISKFYEIFSGRAALKEPADSRVKKKFSRIIDFSLLGSYYTHYLLYNFSIFSPLCSFLKGDHYSFFFKVLKIWNHQAE